MNMIYIYIVDLQFVSQIYIYRNIYININKYIYRKQNK